MCFDTTASNTGFNNGACILIENLMGRQLLNFACRHQVTMREPVNGPEILLFKRFKSDWPKINKNEITSGICEYKISKHFARNEITEIINFNHQQLVIVHKRDDYVELLYLIKYFLGKVPKDNFGTQFKFGNQKQYTELDGWRR